jgi:hypothetical protein
MNQFFYNSKIINNNNNYYLKLNEQNLHKFQLNKQLLQKYLNLFRKFEYFYVFKYIFINKNINKYALFRVKIKLILNYYIIILRNFLLNKLGLNIIIINKIIKTIFFIKKKKTNYYFEMFKLLKKLKKLKIKYIYKYIFNFFNFFNKYLYKKIKKIKYIFNKEKINNYFIQNTNNYLFSFMNNFILHYNNLKNYYNFFKFNKNFYSFPTFYDINYLNLTILITKIPTGFLDYTTHLNTLLPKMHILKDDINYFSKLKK